MSYVLARLLRRKAKKGSPAVGFWQIAGCAGTTSSQENRQESLQIVETQKLSVRLYSIKNRYGIRRHYGRSSPNVGVAASLDTG